MLQHAAVSVSGLFVGEGWHLTLGALFMLIVIFLPGGLMEGVNRVMKWLRSWGRRGDAETQPRTTPAE
jgi:ABC-type branched-subunit amino acid transport system permease subunit